MPFAVFETSICADSSSSQWALPGFIYAMGGPPCTSGWTHLYQVSFFFGYIVSGGLHVLFNWLAPPAGLGEQVDFALSSSDESVVTAVPTGLDKEMQAVA